MAFGVSGFSSFGVSQFGTVGGLFNSNVSDPSMTLTTLNPFDFQQLSDEPSSQQAIASGILLKRDDAVDRGPAEAALLGVDLVAVVRRTSKVAINGDETLRIIEDVLQQYKSLHNLAVARRCIESHGNVVPLHVAIAYKGIKVLEAWT